METYDVNGIYKYSINKDKLQSDLYDFMFILLAKPQLMIHMTNIYI